jgi:hypothetical protein
VTFKRRVLSVLTKPELLDLGRHFELGVKANMTAEELVKCLTVSKRAAQSAAAQLDRHPAVQAFVKNAGLGFAIPYVHDGEDHDYLPDFIVRLAGTEPLHLILETKGYDPMKELKAAAAERWVRAVNAEGTKGRWAYRMVSHPSEVPAVVDSCRASEALVRLNPRPGHRRADGLPNGL